MPDIEKFIPVPAERLLVRQEARPTETAGGIAIPTDLTGLERVSVESARVIKAGERVAKVLGEEIPPGTRIAYRSMFKDIARQELGEVYDEPNLTPQARERKGGQLFVINVKDIIAILDEETQVGPLS